MLYYVEQGWPTASSSYSSLEKYLTLIAIRFQCKKGAYLQKIIERMINFISEINFQLLFSILLLDQCSI